MDFVADHGNIGKPLEELEELCRTNNCVLNVRGSDQVLLSKFRAEKPAFEQTFRSHEGQRDVMSDARGRFIREKVPGRSLEKIQHCRVLP